MRNLSLFLCILTITFSSFSVFNYKVSGYGTTAGGYGDFSSFSKTSSDMDYFIDGKIALELSNKYRDIVFGAKIDMETSYNFKEAYLFVQLPFARIEAGRVLNIAQKLHIGVWDASYSKFNNGSYAYKLIDNPNITHLSSTSITSDDNSQKISLITGRFKGFQAGVSYAPGQADGYEKDYEYYDQKNNKKFDRSYGAGLRFNQDFGFYKLAASAGIGQMDGANNYKLDTLGLRDSFEKRTEYTSGLNITAGNLTLSGSGKIIKEDESQYLKSKIKDGYVVAGSAYYSFLKFAASLNYQRSDMRINDLIGESDIVNLYQLSLKYNPYKGFNIWLSTGYLDMYDNTGLLDNEASGVFGLLGITYSF